MALATAELFIAESAFVHITGRGKEALDAVVSRLGPPANGIVADSSNVGDLDRVFAGVDQLDILFASAGIGIGRQLLAEVTPADFDRRN
jgi:NAD(P)-dependent dehydrogenase (short-subunit alcohol dehydrogenase family)